MEDIGSIVWTLLLVGLGVFSLMNKKTREKGDHSPKEAWPSWDQEAEKPQREVAWEAVEEQEEREHTPNRQSGKGQRKNRVDMDTQFGGKPMDTTPNRVKSTKNDASLVPRTASASAPESDNASEFQHECPENEVTSDLTADFDLRRAVIYSEMLKPKFDE